MKTKFLFGLQLILLVVCHSVSADNLDIKIGVLFHNRDRILYTFLKEKIKGSPNDYKGIAIHQVRIQDENKLLEYGTLKKLADCNITVDLSFGNEAIFTLSELLKIPFLTLKSIPRGLLNKYLFSIRPSQEHYAEALSKVIRYFAPDKTAIVYEAGNHMPELAAYLSTVTINDSLATSMMPAVRLDSKQELDWSLTVLMRRHFTNVILICDPNNVDKLVTRALQIGVIKEESRWIVLNMEIDRNISSPALLGLLGLRMSYVNTDEAEIIKTNFDRENRGRQYYREYAEITYVALHDLVELLSQIKKYQNRYVEGRNEGIDRECPLKTRPVSTQILATLHQMRFIGKTGEIRFNKINERVIDKLDIVNVKRLEADGSDEDEKSIIKKVGSWIAACAKQGKSDLVTFQEETESSLKWNGDWWEELQCSFKRKKKHNKYEKKKRRVIVKTILEAPFCMLKDSNTSRDKENKFEGFSIDMINEIAKETPHLEFALELSKQIAYGSKNDKGQWTGLIGELIEKKAHLTLGAITITAEREQVIDFSKPFMDFKISMMLEKPKGEDMNLFAFLLPFHRDVWISTIIVVFVVAIVLTIIDRFSPTGHRALALSTGEGTGDEFSLSNSVWFATGSMLGQGGDNTPRSGSGRILVASFWLFILIMISTYTANLAAYFTAKSKKSSISSLEDLTAQSEIKYGVLKEGSLYAFFKGSDIGLYKSMFGQMLRSNTFVNSTKVGVERVRAGKYAYLTEEPYLDYYNQRSPCNTMLIKNLLEAKSYGIGLQKDSELTNMISVSILKLREKGVIEKLRLKWWDHRTECPGSGNLPTVTSRLGLHNLAGVFIILGGGAVLSLVLLVVENRFKKVWFMFASKGEKPNNETASDTPPSILVSSQQTSNSTVIQRDSQLIQFKENNKNILSVKQRQSHDKRIPDVYASAPESNL